MRDTKHKAVCMSFFFSLMFLSSFLVKMSENSDISMTLPRRKEQTSVEFLHPHVLELSRCFWKLLPLVFSPLSAVNMCRDRASQQNNLSGSSKANQRLATQWLQKKSIQQLFLCLRHEELFTFCTGFEYFLFLRQLFLVSQLFRFQMMVALVMTFSLFSCNYSVWKVFKRILILE